MRKFCCKLIFFHIVGKRNSDPIDLENIVYEITGQGRYKDDGKGARNALRRQGHCWQPELIKS